MKIFFGFQPRPNRLPAGPRRPARRIPPTNLLLRNQEREENLEQEQEEQEEGKEADGEEEDSFYDDDFFSDPDFENFDFSDFEEFEVYDENDEESELGERERAEVDNETNYDLKERKEMDFNYSREGLELYKQSKDGQSSHRDPLTAADHGGEQQDDRDGFKEDFQFDFENSADFEKYHNERREDNDEKYNEIKDKVNSQLEERYPPQTTEEDYEEFEDFFTSFEPFGFDELPPDDAEKRYQAENDLDKLNLVTDMFVTDMKSPKKVQIDIVA